MNAEPVHATVADPDSATSEARYHSYRTNAVPVAVHLIWILFWIGAVYYLVQYFLPTLQVEIVSPP